MEEKQENEVPKAKDLNSDFDELISDIMKSTDKIVIGLIILGAVFLFGFFVGNLTAAAIGLVIIGVGANLKMFDMKAKSKAMWYMWIAIIILIMVLLGIQGLLPSVKLG